MKNLHILKTKKPSRLRYYNNSEYILSKGNLLWADSKNIYITSDEEITGFENNIWVIKGNRIFLWQNTMALVSNNKPKKIILTTDQDLIKDGVQPIDDEFLEWFVKNPSCEWVEYIVEYKDGYGNWYRYDKEFWDKNSNKPIFSTRYKIIIPQEEPKQETLEEAALKYKNLKLPDDLYDGFISGAKWQAERMYSEEEVLKLWNWLNDGFIIRKSLPTREELIGWFEQFKKK